MGADSPLFHKANIHEKRAIAVFCRAVPLLSVLITTFLAVYGAFENQLVLVWVTAILNSALWLWVVTTACQCIYATIFKLTDCDRGPAIHPVAQRAACGGSNTDSDFSVTAGGGTGECAQFGGSSVVHMIVLPNYQEDESMLAETLRSLAEAEGSKNFWIVLGMEAREGEEGKQKSDRLKMRFESSFARIIISEHPDDIVEKHNDGSQNPEVPGKASNAKYAVSQAYQECSDLGVLQDCVVLTVADADCIMHPLYFSRVGKEFSTLREVNQHGFTMWCAPQFSFRNHYSSPIVSRVWSYVQSTYEFGGLASTSWGGHHMVFSSYSLPLSLAHNAEAWDGDVVAEDHHTSLKCFYYWLYNATYDEERNRTGSLCWKAKIPALRLLPVYLPTKTTSVANEVYWKSWVDRWQQAKRHAHGVSELSYALLATYDAFRTCLIPKRIFSLGLYCHMAQVVIRVWCMHVLPICQTICLATLTIKWLRNNRNIPMCPNKIWFFGDVFAWKETERFVLCGFAGAWVLTWPVVVPLLLMVVSNVLVMYKAFLRPANRNRYASIWHSEDGKIPGAERGLCHLTFKCVVMIMFDCVLGMSWILVPYGCVVEIIAYVNVFRYGNCKFSYVTASKGMPSKKLPGCYGATEKASFTIIDEPLKKQSIEVIA